MKNILHNVKLPTLYKIIGLIIMLNTNAIAQSRAQEILTFWFEDSGSQKWYKKDPNFDNEIKTKFEKLYQKASDEKLSHWLDDPNCALALIILLDQFPRNMYRNTPKAFFTDKLALKYAKLAVAKGHDKIIDSNKVAFMYMPYMHSENIKVHEESIKLFSQPGLEHNLKYAKEHKGIIDRFSRYPHRNTILGRNTTQEEDKFLKEEHSGY